MADYAELTKIRLVSLVLLSMVVGFYLGTRGPVNVPLMILTLAGTALVAAGSQALNQWMEREEDSRMARTAGRPLPAGRLAPAEGLGFGLALSVSGLALLAFGVNFAAALLAFITWASYLGLYTPMKKKTSLCTIFGAVPGALPPLIGWAAAAGSPANEAWILFGILFLWQMPHFLAIAWLYRADYAAAGFRMLSVEDPEGGPVGRQMFLYALALLPVSLLPALAGITSLFYFWGALALGLGFAGLAALCLRDVSRRARPVFAASIIYLSALLLLMVLNKA